MFINQKLTLKYGGHKDQLSKTYWGMDRFRIKSLENLIVNYKLKPDQKQISTKLQKQNYAKKYSIPYQTITNKKKFEHFASRIIRLKKIEIVCLAGFMKVLSKDFIRKFKGKIINIHPSLLPKFKGLDTFNRVLRAKEKFTGCTVHFVDEKLDLSLIHI